MKRAGMFGVLIMIMLAGAACFKSEDPMPATPAPVGPPRPPVSQTPSVPPPSVKSVPSNGLVGTTWSLGDMTVTFKDNGAVWIKGGKLASLAPGGVEGTYSLTGKDLEVSVLGNTKKGSFDGTTLAVEGKPAIRVQ